MPFPSALKQNAKVHHAMKAFDTGMERPLLDMQQLIMRSEDSPLSVAQRELIAAYVSALNNCAYCLGAHEATAVGYGINDGLVSELINEIETANIEANLKPIFRYVKKLTEEAPSLTQEDWDAVINAGWSERALYDAIAVCCAFSFMNRYTNGLGLEAIPTDFVKEARYLKATGYAVANLLRLK